MRVLARAVPVVLLLTFFLMRVPLAQAGTYTKQLAEREAVQKGVDFLSQGSVYWIRDRGCFTCHAVGLGAIASGVNARNGYVVPKHEFDTLARFVLNTQRPDGSLLGGKREVSLTSLMGAGFAMSSRGLAKDYAGQTAKMAKFLLGARTKEGAWAPDYQRDVIIAGDIMTSAFASVLLKEAANLEPAGKINLAAAAGWQKSVNTSALTKTTDVVFALLGMAAGSNEKATAELKNQLFALQNADGSWPLEKGGKSNIIVTSQALFALATAGAGRDEPHVNAAVAFLFSRQRDDGTFVPDGQGKDYSKFVQRFTRTAWATIGLSSILEVNSLVAKRAEVLAELQKEAGSDEKGLHRLARSQLLLHDTQAACQTYEKLISLVPGKPALRLELARAYLSGNDKQKAALTYQKALEGDLPTDARLAALQTLAECFEDTGDKKNASLAYVQLVDPKHALRLAYARRLLPKLTALGAAGLVAPRYGLVTEWEVSPLFAGDGEDGFGKSFAPEKGEPSQWGKFASKDPLGLLDLSAVYKKADHACGYVRLRVSSPAARKGQLRLASEGSVAVWLNGKEVLRKQVARELIFDQDRLDVTLPAGESTLLIKVGQSKGRWGGLAVRLTDRDGKPLEDVKVVAAVTP